MKKTPLHLLNRRSFVAGAVGFGMLASAAGAPLARSAQPTIFAHGGGRIYPADARRMIKLAGGRNARVLISPYSDGNPAGMGRWEMNDFRKMGFRNATVLPLTSSAAARAAISKADLVWFSGGSQKRQVLSLKAVPGVVESLHDAYRAGVVMAGSSAGAAVMSRLMISGGTKGNVYTRAGLGFWPEVVLDQHVIARRREYRLRKVISRNRKLIGIGLDEGSSVTYRGSRVTVSGRVILVTWRDGAILEENLRSGTIVSAGNQG